MVRARIESGRMRANTGDDSWRVFRGGGERGARLPVRLIAVGRRLVEDDGRDVVKRRAYHQLFWVASGSARLTIDGRTRSLEAGRAFITPAGTVNGVREAGAGSVVYSLKFDGSAAAAILAGFGLRASKVYAAGEPPALLFERMRTGLSLPGPRGELAGGAALYEMLSALAERRRVTVPKHGRVVRRALDVVDRELGDPGLNVTTLARRVGVHRSLLAERFSSELGIAPKEYITSLRLRRAVELLQRGDEPVAGVAAACGYENPAYFSRLVRRATGMSPSEIRKAF